MSVACWTKGDYDGEKVLFTEEKGQFVRHVTQAINSSLSLKTDVSQAAVLRCNRQPKRVFQGQTHGHEGFLVSVKEGNKLLADDPRNAEVLKPFLNGDELLSESDCQPKRFVIDFTTKDVLAVASTKEFSRLFSRKYCLTGRRGRGNSKKKTERFWRKTQQRKSINTTLIFSINGGNFRTDARICWKN